MLTCSAGHTNTGQSVLSWVRLVNVFFTFLGLLNLAFLGSTFDGQLDVSIVIFNMYPICFNIYFPKSLRVFRTC